ncbi:MAG TPA: thioredoxin domain-containing protein [Polyangiaceae bacterium]|nr:thioredoxin domain-containing protein [Polyangiaceae bacterium]
MALFRSAGGALALALVNLNVATCRSPAEEGGREPGQKDEQKIVKIDGVDTSALTPREQREWSTYVSELLAPCADQPVSLAQCIKESRPCALCLPAAKFLVKRVTRGGTRSQVEQAFRIRFSPDQVKTVDEGDSPTKGPKDAPVTIVEWADFQCPYCGAAAPVLDKLPEQYPGNVRLVFKNYPLSIHEHSEVAARGAVAAGKQGKFWEMHHLLFANQESGLDRDVVVKLAKSIGLDEKKFNADMDSEAVADAVNRDRKQAEKLELKGTPMIYVNGRHFELEQFNLLEDLNDWIELEIEQRTGKKVTAEKVEITPFSAEPGAPPRAAPSASAASSAAPPAPSAKKP